MTTARSRRRPADTAPTDEPAKMIGVRVPARMNDQLEALARRENNGVSAVVRRLLTKALRDDAGAAS